MKPPTEWIEIPVFPLPNVVFFPHTRLPLHIFEPRYRRMVEDVLDNEGRIAMALLKEGREEPETGAGGMFSIGGMGDVEEVEELSDGRYNIVLAGRWRYRLLEVVRWTPYRVARVQLLEDQAPKPGESDRLTAELIERVGRLKLPVLGPSGRDRLEAMDFPALVNTLCSSNLVDDHSKQILLEMNSLKTRATAVIQLLDRQINQEAFIAEFEHLRPEDVRVN